MIGLGPGVRPYECFIAPNLAVFRCVQPAARWKAPRFPERTRRRAASLSVLTG